MRMFHWAAVASICYCGLQLGAIAGAQEADPPEVEGAVAAPANVEQSAPEPARTESYGQKTGLRIFDRDKPESKPGDAAATDESMAASTEEAPDWLGALSALWKEWTESDAAREFASRRANNRTWFVNRAFIQQHDADRSRDLTCDEAPQGLQEAFDHLDGDHDGVLTRAELRRHMRLARRSGAPVESVYGWMIRTDAGRMKKESLQQAYDQLQQLDGNHDGKIDDSVTKKAPASETRPNARQTAFRGWFGRRR